jgi:hypothetical protein
MRVGETKFLEVGNCSVTAMLLRSNTPNSLVRPDIPSSCSVVNYDSDDERVFGDRRGGNVRDTHRCYCQWNRLLANLADVYLDLEIHRL